MPALLRGVDEVRDFSLSLRNMQAAVPCALSYLLKRLQLHTLNCGKAPEFRRISPGALFSLGQKEPSQ